MAWKELPPENLAAPLADLLAGLDCLGAARLAAEFLAGRRIWVHPAAHRQIGHQFAGVAEESGGLLLGRAFQVGSGSCRDYNFLTFVTVAAPGPERLSTAVSLHLDIAVWNDIQPFLEQGLQVVGWYHSHPWLGAFFSAQDRRTQAAFFRQPFMVGLVIDPYRPEQKCFAGPAVSDCTDRLVDPAPKEWAWIQEIPLLARTAGVLPAGLPAANGPAGSITRPGP